MTDWLDPHVEWSDEDIINHSIPKKQTVPTPEEDETNLPNSTIYQTFLDTSGICRGHGSRNESAEECLVNEELTHYC